MANYNLQSKLDFTNTEVAFAHKTDKELKQTAFLFRMMNNKLLSNIGTFFMIPIVKLNIPIIKNLIKKTIFNQFCGGESLLDCQEAIDHLHRNGALTILDYGAESKSSSEDLNAVMEETIRAIELAAANHSVPVISTKISGLVNDNILMKIDAGKDLDEVEQKELSALEVRLELIFSRAKELEVGVFVDAEESWIQEAIDELVIKAMLKYNREKAIVYNTYQLYRHDKLAQMKADHRRVKNNGCYFGAKLVRGAYMEKERARAIEKGYKSPIHKTKTETDTNFDEAVRFCMKNYISIASCCASHNVKSNLLQARLIDEMEVEKNHPHLNFCQLFGMSDNISFNLAAHGYSIAKYVPYGPLEEVIPYLVRRANENTSVMGEASRELAFIKTELKRRKLN